MLPFLQLPLFSRRSGGGGGLAVSLSTYYSYTSTGVAGTITSPTITSTVTGNTGALSYSWAITGTDSVTITSPAASSTTFKKTSPFVRSYLGSVTLTVTDAGTGTSVSSSPSLTVELERIG